MEFPATRRAPQTVSTSVLWMIFTCQPGTGFPVASDSAWSIPFAPITYRRPRAMSSGGRRFDPALAAADLPNGWPQAPLPDETPRPRIQGDDDVAAARHDHERASSPGNRDRGSIERLCREKAADGRLPDQVKRLGLGNGERRRGGVLHIRGAAVRRPLRRRRTRGRCSRPSRLRTRRHEEQGNA